MTTVQRNGADAPNHIIRFNPNERRHFIGGSDARIIMGDDQEDLIRLWREKRGEAEPQDLSDILIVQLGTVTEVLNRAWYQRASGHTVKDIQKRVRHPIHKWMAATLDGTVEQTGAVFEAKFMLPWAFTEEAAAEKHMAQLQHNMWVTAYRSAVLSIITGGGNGLRSRSMPIRFISTSWSRQKRSFGASFKTASHPISSISKHLVQDSRRLRSSICRPPINGPN